jgi:hypothetical protein
MREINISVSPLEPGLPHRVFGFPENAVRQTRPLGDRLSITAENYAIALGGATSWSYVVQFLSDQHTNIAVGLLTSLLYDMMKNGAARVFIGRREVKPDMQEIQAIIQRILQDDTASED